MPDVFAADFSRFTQEKLRPIVTLVQTRKRSGLLYGLITGVILFTAFALAAYFVMTPFRNVMKESSISTWPLMILAPLAIAMVGFSIVYILSLRSGVKEFRENLVAGLAEFVDPSLVHENNRPIPPEELEESLLFRNLAKPIGGSDRFRGRVGDVAVEFCDVLVKHENKIIPALGGLYFIARFPNKFKVPYFSFPAKLDVSRGGLEEALRAAGFPIPNGLIRIEDPSEDRQVLIPSGSDGSAGRFVPPVLLAEFKEMRLQRGCELFLSVRGDRLCLALIAARERSDLPGVFEGFDFANCREFCRDARWAMHLAREIEKRSELFQ